MTPRITLILTLLAFAPAARANDGSFHGQGATVYAAVQAKVVMERESIIIRHDPKAKWERRWAADCTFTFRSKARRPVEVQMGFPNWRVQGDGRGYGVKDFVALVNGKKVFTVHKKVDRGKSRRGMRLPRGVRLAFDKAFTWKVTFPPKGRLVVRNTFRFGGVSTMGPARRCFHGQDRRRLKHVFWKRAKPPKGGRDFDQGSTCTSVTYIVTTGRTWGGPIGQADIAIQIPPRAWPHLVVPLPAASEVSGGWVRWRRRNWTPRRNLTVVFVHPIPNDETNAPPLFNGAREVKAWLRFARLNRFSADMAARLRRAYQSFLSGKPDPSIAFFDRKNWNARAPTAGSAGRRKHEAAVRALERFEKRSPKKGK